MDQTALFKLSYGLYIVGSSFDGKTNAQISNTVFQVNAEPITVGISLDNNNYTKELVEKSGVFSVNVLSGKAEMPLIANFGFQSGREMDKFTKFPCTLGLTGSPLLAGAQIAAHLEARVISSMVVGSHTIFIGEVIATQNLAEQQMTYADYHVLKNKGAKPAPAQAGNGQKCMICGYVEADEALLQNPDYTCPICGVGPDQFKPL